MSSLKTLNIDITLRNVDEKHLVDLVNALYGVRVERLTLGPQGEDSYSYIGNSAAGKRYFVRLERKASSGISLERAMNTTIRMREKTRLWQTVAPIPNRRGKTVSRFHGHILCVFPHIEGVRLYDIAATNDDIGKAARLMARLHNAKLGWFKGLRKERFDNPFEENIRRVLRDLNLPRFTRGDIYQRELGQTVDRERETIILAFEEMKRLRTQILRLHCAQVLTHGDANTANFIKDNKGRLHLTDWGDIGLGPPERDLFHFSGNSLEPFVNEYLSLRKTANLSAEIFAFYYYRWALQEISDYSSRILYWKSTLGEKQHAWRELQDYVPVPNQKMTSDSERISDVLDRVR